MGADRKATIEVIADVNKAVKNFQSLESRFQKLTKQMARDIEKVDFDPTSESAVKLRREIQKTGQELVEFGNDGDAATDELKRDLKGLDDQFDSLGVGSKKAGSNVRKMGIAIKAAAAAAAAFVAIQIGRKLAQLARDALKVNVAFDSIRASFLAAEEAGADANAEFAFAREVANELGLEVQTLTSTYGGFLNAAIRSNLTVEQSRSIFLGVSTAARALGLSTEALEGSLLAVQQIASKGTLSLEELTGQLGERIPGVLPLLAAKLDLTTGELTKMVAAGKLLAVDVLPQLGEALQEAFGAAALDQIDNYQATMQRLVNDLSEAQDQFAKGFVDDFVEAINEATDSNFNLARAMRTTGETFGFLINVAAPLVKTIFALDAVIRQVSLGGNLATVSLGALVLQMTNILSVVAKSVPQLSGFAVVIDGIRENAARLSAEGLKRIADGAAEVGDAFGEVALALGQAQADFARANAEFIEQEVVATKAKEALEKLQKGTEKADEATKSFAGSIKISGEELEFFGEGAKGAAKETESLANSIKISGEEMELYAPEIKDVTKELEGVDKATEKAGKSTKKLADETERSLSLFDQIAERLKDAAKEAAELEKQEAKAGVSHEELAKSTVLLQKEFDVLDGQYSRTIDETNRLNEISLQLGETQSVVADTAKDAGKQEIFFGAGTAEAAAAVEELAQTIDFGVGSMIGLSDATIDAILRQRVFGTEVKKSADAEKGLGDEATKAAAGLKVLQEATEVGFDEGIKGAKEYKVELQDIVALFRELVALSKEFATEEAA